MCIENDLSFTFSYYIVIANYCQLTFENFSHFVDIFSQHQRSARKTGYPEDSLF